MPRDAIGVFGRVIRVPDSTDSDEAVRPLLPGPLFRSRLADFLCFLVPLAIEEQSRQSREQIDGIREELLDTIAAHGDDLQFGGTHQRSARVALAKAMALLATAEGGVTILGVHACTEDHEGCPGSKTSGAPDDAP
ncbi:hypothetical protein OG413_43715 [Streptomyces sp. NBC_01433]|uniref:hypothetical protein n=1 Tax=Streptomyces sp. NBC_01433 TaxID=2903864 RepID=UPI002253C775|nr:hypothetical protein [Streptomyces sp. NBC_01433]MCX4682093.1 hypothetical protein [Streptomyces sp. NBC_01433]